MSAIARGSFTVKIQPEGAGDAADGVTLGRMLLDKQYDGDLIASAQGQMLTAMTTAEGSAGYVAIERVTGRLAGRDGSFVLQHSGSMDRSAQTLSISIVPDSGSRGLAGLIGTLAIVVRDGKHFYELSYTLPER